MALLIPITGSYYLLEHYREHETVNWVSKREYRSKHVRKQLIASWASRPQGNSDCYDQTSKKDGNCTCQSRQQIKM